MNIEQDNKIFYGCDSEHAIEIGTIDDVKDLIELLQFIVKQEEERNVQQGRNNRNKTSFAPTDGEIRNEYRVPRKY